MPRSARQAGGSESQMCKLPGGASSLQPALPQQERDSTSSYQKNPCPTPTRTGQTKNPCQKAEPKINQTAQTLPKQGYTTAVKAQVVAKPLPKPQVQKNTSPAPVTNKEKKKEKQRLAALQKEKEREKRESQKKSQKEVAMPVLEEVAPKKPIKLTPPKHDSQTHLKIPIEVTPPHNPKANHNLKTHIYLLKNQIQIVKKM